VAAKWRRMPAANGTDEPESPFGRRIPSDGAYRDRTGDLRLAKPALSQLS
jgi:hypothetical protein